MDRLAVGGAAQFQLVEPASEIAAADDHLLSVGGKDGGLQRRLHRRGVINTFLGGQIPHSQRSIAGHANQLGAVRREVHTHNPVRVPHEGPLWGRDVTARAHPTGFALLPTPPYSWPRIDKGQ